MAQPGMPGGQFPGEDAIMRRIKDLERTVQQMAAANPLGTAGIRAIPDGIVVEGSQTVNGPLEVNGDGKIDGPLEVNGNSVFNGVLSINGALNLQPGIIENDALTDPIVLSTAGLTQNNFPVNSGGNVYAQANITVPDGYTRATVVCMVVGGAYNNTAGADYLYIASSINGVFGGETPALAGAGSYTSAAANGIRSLTGLSGGVINLGCMVRGGGWAAAGSNLANMNAFVYFRR